MFHNRCMADDFFYSCSIQFLDRPLSSSRVWKILNELFAIPQQSTPHQALMDMNAERRYAWCKIVINLIEVQAIFFADIMWTVRHAFCRMKCTIGRARMIGRWKMLHALPTIEIKYGLRLIFGVEIIITGWSSQYCTRARYRPHDILKFFRT